MELLTPISTEFTGYKNVLLNLNYEYNDIASSMDDLKIMNIYERIFLRKAKFMYKISKAITPSYIFFSLRPINETIQSLRSVNTSSFQIPRPQKEIFKQSLIYSGPIIWNNLPHWLKNLETVNSFHNNCIKWMKSDNVIKLIVIFIPSVYKVYRGYIVFAFSCVSV